MADYYLAHERSLFEQILRPALAEAWCRRSFAPCRPLADLTIPLAPAGLNPPDARAFLELDEAERVEQLLDARDLLTFLRDLYCRSHQAGRLLVIESIF